MDISNRRHRVVETKRHRNKTTLPTVKPVVWWQCLIITHRRVFGFASQSRALPRRCLGTAINPKIIQTAPRYKMSGDLVSDVDYSERAGWAGGGGMGAAQEMGRVTGLPSDNHGRVHSLRRPRSWIPIDFPTALLPTALSLKNSLRRKNLANTSLLLLLITPKTPHWSLVIAMGGHQRHHIGDCRGETPKTPHR